jgi:hypothetical protein
MEKPVPSGKIVGYNSPLKWTFQNYIPLPSKNLLDIFYVVIEIHTCFDLPLSETAYNQLQEVCTFIQHRPLTLD